METNFKNILAPAVIELNRMNEELQAENERLKAELKQTEAQDQVVIDGLRKENAKLKCLALHAMVGYAFAKMNVLAEKYNYNFTSVMYYKDFSRWDRLRHLWREAYRKARESLKNDK